MSAQTDSRAQSQAQYEKMTGTPIPKLVLTLAAPTVVSMLVSSIYNMADTFFIGQMNDPNQVAAATISMPLFIFMTALALVSGNGIGCFISLRSDLAALRTHNTGKGS